ncbi:MAG: tRNA lysidine(34) synthetase TilS [Gemmataceae bacterium]|nr:tRNA lysidine(34) synthetase TilS [Gemmataceae bacterium]
MKVDVPLLDKVRHWLSTRDFLPGGTVVAVSGGPDSVALLRALLALGVGPLVVAHLNHQLRGAESDGDEQFVRDRCAGLTLRCERLDVAAQARVEGANLEAVARRLRYRWLVGIAQETGSRWIATGHNAGDQAETVLHRLLRGSGLQGLRGIAPQREAAPGITIVRPLLEVPRSEVIAYLESEAQTYRQDSSNADRRFMRNRIRHELLPLLEEHYNPAVARILCRLATQAEEICRETEGRIAVLLAEVERPRAGPLLIFDRERLACAARHQVRGLFRHVWHREGWPMGEMSFAHWDRLAGLTHGEDRGIDLPGGVRATRQERVVQLSRA